MKGFIPVILYVVTFYVSGKVASGEINPLCQNAVVNSFVEIGGYAFMGATGVMALIHAFTHRNVQKNVDPINMTKTTTSISVPQTSFIVEGSGTPPTELSK